jgi:hypothetical protein
MGVALPGGGISGIGWPPAGPASSAQGTAPTVLIPGRHEEPHKGDWNQPEDNATEEGFDH